jgi:hypothetical protein
MPTAPGSYIHPGNVGQQAGENPGVLSLTLTVSTSFGSVRMAWWQSPSPHVG